MEISLMQGILIGLVTAFCYSGMLLGIYTNRAIVMAFFVGLILGDIPTALTFGALAELAYMGFGVGAGGTVTLKDQGITPENALALSFPFAVLFQFVTTFLYTFFAGNPKMAEKAIENGHFGKFKLIAHSTYIGLAVAGFIIGILSALSRPALEAFVNALPKWLISGFGVAGGLIPAIGFAMILSVMLKKELTPYVILGYICVAYLELPTMAVALVGSVFALIAYYQNSNKQEVVVGTVQTSEVEDFSNGI